MAVNIDKIRCSTIENCPADGICIQICALNYVSKGEDGYPQVDNECPECGLCVMNCPKSAITKSEW